MNAESRRFAALAAQVEHYRLIFRWPERSASLVMPAFFLFAVAVHAFAFYIFQVVYPPTLVNAPPPAQVTLITPATPQGAALLQWVQAQDPAAVASVQEVLPPALGEIRYTPSYATVQTLPLNAEFPPEPVTFPSAFNLLDYRESAAPTAPVTPLAVASSLAFSESLRGRDTAASPAIVPVAKSQANLRPTVFLVGVNDRGEVRYCFLQESSTDQGIDTEAEALLRGRAFSHSETLLEWGFATFTWGAEAYAPRPASSSPQPATVPGT